MVSRKETYFLFIFFFPNEMHFRNIKGIRGDKVPDLSGIPDFGLCSCLVSGLGL